MYGGGMKIPSYCVWITLLSIAGSASLLAETELTAEQKIEALEQRIRLLESKLDSVMVVQQRMESATQAQPAAPSRSNRDNSNVSVGARGLRFESEDGNYRFRIGVLTQMDGRFYLTDRGSDTWDMRRIDPVFAGTLWNDLDFQIMPELAGTVRILDAYGDYRVSDQLRVRFGNFKTPLGLELLQSSGSQRFLENGYVTQLLPNRDLGVQVYGKTMGQKIDWKAGIFNGAVDGHNGAASTNSNNSFDLAGSVHLYPFRDDDSSMWKGLGVGVAASWGRNHRDVSLRIRNQQQLDVLTSKEISENGTLWRINPQLTYYRGPFGLMAEYMLSSRVLGQNAAIGYKRYYNEAWSIEAGYVLTGESNSYGMIVPSRPFRLGTDGIGAWEVVMRYTALRMDRSLWDNGLLSNQQPNEANGWGVAVNWYATENWKAILSYDYTDYTGGNANGGDRKADQAILSRVQVNF
jgi:phosphate-selective porin OprO/OprP